MIGESADDASRALARLAIDLQQVIRMNGTPNGSLQQLLDADVIVTLLLFLSTSSKQVTNEDRSIVQDEEMQM